MKSIKFSLAKNALSSLHISFESFKKIYYHHLRHSEYEEHVKIGIIFLENAIELLLKTILADQNEQVIFKQPDSRRAIAAAQSQVDDTHSLLDILISTGANVKTIDYHVTVEEYNNSHFQSEKVAAVLSELGKYRNSLTHFGIEISSRDEVLCLFSNTFDIIYNYLYPQLLSLDEIGEYFSADELFVKTVHGIRPLIDKNDEYTNILDLLDVVLGDDNHFLFNVCKANPANKIDVFEDFVNQAFESKKMAYLEEKNQLHICRETTLESDGLEFTIHKGETDYWIMFRYLPFYHASYYFDSNGRILFFVMFTEQKIYLYNKDKTYPGFNEPDEDRQWEYDLQQGFCTKLELSKNNIIKAFETIIDRNNQLFQ